MEEIGPYKGTWSRISGKMGSPSFNTAYFQFTPSGFTIQENSPRGVSADSDGIARIIPSKFRIYEQTLTAAELRCEFRQQI